MPASVELANIPGVELIRTGSWPISTGQWTVSAEDLVAAVAALNCPAVRKPRLKIGHVDPRFNAAGVGGPAMDGEPAVGWVDNLRVADNGQSLVGDYTGVPGWLGAVMASAYPDRSVEGFHAYRCQLNHTHPFVLTGVALLGVTPPGVGTLKSLSDVARLYGVDAAEVPEGAVPVAATFSGGPVAAAESPKPGSDHSLREYWVHGKGAIKIKWGEDGDFRRCVRELGKYVSDPEGLCNEYHQEALGAPPGKGHVHAAADSKEDAVPSPKPTRADRIRQQFNVTATESRWIVEVDDDSVVVIDDSDRSLHRIPVTVTDDAVTFGPSTPVRMAYVPAAEPVAASRVVFASRAESRPDQVYAAADEPPNDPDHTPTQGTPQPLPPETRPVQVPTPQTPESAPVQPAAEPDPVPETEEGDSMSLGEFRSALGLDETADEAAVLAAFKERLKTSPTQPTPDSDGADEPQPVDDKQLVAAAAQQEQFAAAIGQIQTLSAELAAIRAEKAANEKASFFAAAVQQGQIAPADRESWEVRYDKAPEVVRDIIGAMAPGTAVPVAAAGYTGSPDVAVSDEDLFKAFFSPDDNARLESKGA